MSGERTPASLGSTTILDREPLVSFIQHKKLGIAKMSQEAHNSGQNGDKALAGEEEYLEIFLFPAKDYDRRISARGESIIVWDPSNKNDPAHWERDSITENEEADVPANCVVRVIQAWIKFI